MDRGKSRDAMADVVFGGGPPPPLPKPVPEVRRDSLGRRITELRLEALRSGQFKPGRSGNPGGNRKRQREHANAFVIHLLKTGKLQPSDTIADFLNLLGDMETRSEQRGLKRMLKESNMSDAKLSSVIGDSFRDFGIGASSKTKASRPSRG